MTVGQTRFFYGELGVILSEFEDIILMRDWSFQDRMTVGIFRGFRRSNSNEGLVIPRSNDSWTKTFFFTENWG